MLETLEVPYLVGGSLASSLWGIPRSTQDADLIADLRTEHVQPFVDLTSSEFYIAIERVHQAVRRRSSFNLIHLKTMIKVDVFMLRGDLQSLQEMTRRRILPSPVDPDVQLPVTSPEDIVLQKLHWYRQGSGVSDRQWTDVMGVLKVQRGALDLDYLRDWAKRIEVADLLAKAFEDAGIETDGSNRD